MAEETTVEKAVYTLRDFNFKPRGREHFIAVELLQGKSREEVARKYFPWVSKREPYIFRENPGRGAARQPKPLKDQYRLFIWKITDTINKMEKLGWKMQEPVNVNMRWTEKHAGQVKWRKNFIQQLINEGLNDPLEEPSPPENFVELPVPATAVPEPGTVEPVIAGQPARIVESEPTIVQELETVYRLMMKARSFAVQRELGGEFLDFVSTRALKDACSAVLHGISPKEMINALTKTWPDDSKNELKSWTGQWSPKENTDIDLERYPVPLEGGHKLLGYVHKLALARIPIYLVGPAGCGKSFMARDLADLMDLEYGEVPLTAGATPSWLVGAHTMAGYTSRPYVDLYNDGGIMTLEELDAGDPNLLIIINNSISQESFFNPVTGEEIRKSKNFIVVATGNTWGVGATRLYTARSRLDAATLDRFRQGRVEIDYDPNIERNIVDAYKKLAIEKDKKPKKARP